MDADRQKLVGCLTIGGGGAFVLGLIVFFMMMGGGAAAALQRGDFSVLLFAGLPLGLCVVGVVAGLFGLSIGYKAAFGDGSNAPVVESSGAYVIACYILTKKGDTVFDPDMFDPDDIVHYVQLEFADGRKRELRTAPGLYATIGEGQRGTVTVQGDWLSSFVMEPPRD